MGNTFKVSGPNKKGGISDLFIPAGRNLEGWHRIVRILEHLTTVISLEDTSRINPLVIGKTHVTNQEVMVEASLFNEGGLD